MKEAIKEYLKTIEYLNEKEYAERAWAYISTFVPEQKKKVVMLK